MKVNKSNPRHWILLALQGVFTWLAILLRPFTRKPEPPVILLYGHQFSGNLKSLYLEWQESRRGDFDLYFLTLDPEQANTLAGEGIRALRCSVASDMIMLTRARVLISDHGLHLMSPLLRWSDIQLIDVWHGIPFKGFTPRDFKLQHRYLETWVSSPLLAELYGDRFGFPVDKIRSLGYARTDQLFQAAGSNASRTPKRVLYAPTWQQDENGRELFPFGENATSFVQKVADCCAAVGATLVVRSHLNSEITQATNPNTVFCSQRDFPDTEDLLLEADLLICDWSSIAFDYLVLKRPTIFLDVPAPFKHGFSLDQSFRAGEVVESMESLLNSLAGFLTDPTAFAATHRKRQAEVIDQLYAPDSQGCAAQIQLDRLRELTQ